MDRDAYGNAWSVSGHICGSGMSGRIGGAGKEEASGSDMRFAVPLADGGFISGQLHRRTPLQI